MAANADAEVRQRIEQEVQRRGLVGPNLLDSFDALVAVKAKSAVTAADDVVEDVR